MQKPVAKQIHVIEISGVQSHYLFYDPSRPDGMLEDNISYTQLPLISC